MSDIINVRVNQVQSEQRTYLYVPADDRNSFPGIETYFKLIDKDTNKELSVHMETSGRIPGLGDFFESHPLIKKGTVACIQVIKPDVEYYIWVKKC